MRYVAMLLLPLLSLTSLSCKGVQVDTEDAVYSIRRGSTAAVAIGLRALSTDQEMYEKVKEQSTNAREAITGVVLPLFEGATVKTVSKSAADFALGVLNDRIDPFLKGIIQASIDSALHVLQMPPNPTDELSDDQRRMLVALFRGIVDGINEFGKWEGPKAPTTDKPAVEKVDKLDFDYGGNKPE